MRVYRGGVAIGLTQDEADSNHFSASATFTQDQYDALWAGSLYVNIHSASYPGGELRGQLLPGNVIVLWSTLSGDNEVPAVVTSASGRAALTVDTSTKALVLHVNTSDLSDASAGHIHQGNAGTNGAVAIALEQDASNSNHFSVVSVFSQDQYDALWASGLYINIHSTTNPGGELRGQLVP